MNKRIQRKSRQRRIRARISGTKEQPRMSVFRSLKHITVQFIDDLEGKTLAAASSAELKSKGKKIEIAAEVGKLAAKKALEKGIKKVVFDRGGNVYHGRIKQLAEGARSAGLEF